MDTNQFNDLIKAYTENKSWFDGIPIMGIIGMVLTALISLLTPLVLAYTHLIQNRANAEAKKIATEIAVGLEQVHATVNSNQAAMVKKFEEERAIWKKEVDTLRNDILQTTKELATATEEKRGDSKAAAVLAAHKPEPVAAPSFTPELIDKIVAQIGAAMKAAVPPQTAVKDIVEVLESAEPIKVQVVKK